MFVGLIGLHANDGLYALRLAFLVKIKNAVHIAVVGHAEGGLTICRRTSDEFVQSGRPVQHGKLRVDMQVGERIAHGEAPFRSNADCSSGVRCARARLEVGAGSLDAY